MNDVTTIVSAVETAVRLAVDVPFLLIGLVLGVLVYRYLLRTNPTLLGHFLTTIDTDVQKVALDVASAVKKEAAKTETSAASASASGSGSTSSGSIVSSTVVTVPSAVSETTIVSSSPDTTSVSK